MLRNGARGQLTRYAWVLGPPVALAVTLALLSVLAGASRRAPSEPEPVRASSASEVVAVIADRGYKGATLVVFDNYINTMDKDERYQYYDVSSQSDVFAADETNLTTALISSGAVRRVIVILPDSEWSARIEYFRSAWDFFPSGTGYRFRFAGEPIEIYPASSPPQPSNGERPIVLVDEALQSAYPAELLSQWTDSRVAGLTILQGGR